MSVLMSDEDGEREQGSRRVYEHRQMPVERSWGWRRINSGVNFCFFFLLKETQQKNDCAGDVIILNLIFYLYFGMMQ